ncbi:glycosyltransferase family 2 protein [Sulfobacillus thermosulfidooxidans]|uniref:glycosyltransferase family 2 protein n=1 Tax=Sulfobacillus thermosulfidooxidans TaxID=28034 RepID=UPI0004251521|nr:glycosyltransferase family 2 protein [Sulfobacillus thermosulfidooxidans]
MSNSSQYNVDDQVITIVIVNYQSDSDTLRLVDSLNHQYPIVIVDNSATLHIQSSERLRIICPPRNVGYAAGVNLALKSIATPYVGILNPDIIIDDIDSILTMVAFMESHPQIGIAAPRLDNPDGTRQYSCRTFYTPWLPLFIRALPWVKSVRKHLMADIEVSYPILVDWVTGAAMIVRRSAYESIGPMDDKFFLYLEDTDWCYRMWQGGWQIAYVPFVRWIHFHQRQSRGWRREVWWFKWHHIKSFVRYLFKRRWSSFYGRSHTAKLDVLFPIHNSTALTEQTIAKSSVQNIKRLSR